MMDFLPVVYHPSYSIPWPDAHRFPMAKFAMLRDHLVSEGVVTAEQFVEPVPVSEETLLRVHDLAYWQALRDGTWDDKAMRRAGLGWSEDLVLRTTLGAGGTVRAVQLAFAAGLACNAAGGTHHAFRDAASGFCLLNDLAIAAQYALDRGLAQKILILDCDVHQGDGTALIFAEERRVFTCSFHCDKNFPFRKQVSNLDVPLARGTGDGEYLDKLHEVVPRLLDEVAPDLVLYDGGADVFAGDSLGHLELSHEGMMLRDLFVLRACVAREIPTVTVIGGGYSKDLDELAYRHSFTIRAAAQVWQDVHPLSNPSAVSLR
jgi:acetoin utilization deacetylase AcuC-like enzyme